MRRGVRIWGQARRLREGAWPALKAELPFDVASFDGVELDIEHEGGHAPDVEAAARALAANLAADGWGGIDVIDHDAGVLTRWTIAPGEVRFVERGIDDVLEPVVRR